jgi:hypothetical protein
VAGERVAMEAADESKRSLNFAIGSVCTLKSGSTFDPNRTNLFADASIDHVPSTCETRDAVVSLSRKYSSLDPTLNRIYAHPVHPPALEQPIVDPVRHVPRGSIVQFNTIMRINSCTFPAKIPRSDSQIHQRPLPSLPAEPSRLLDFKYLKTVILLSVFLCVKIKDNESRLAALLFLTFNLFF